MRRPFRETVTNLERLAADVRDDVLPQRLAAHSNQVGHAAATAVLHHDPKLRSMLKAPLETEAQSIVGQ